MNISITKLVTEGYEIIEKLWEVDKCNLAESEVYLNACCGVSVCLHGLLQEALVHNAVTKVVTGEHLHGAKENYQRKILNYIIFLPLCLSRRWVTEAEIVLFWWQVNTEFYFMQNEIMVYLCRNIILPSQ